MSYERDAKAKLDADSNFPEKIDIPILKYFWQSNPLFKSRVDSIPKFLRDVSVLSNFSDNELRVISQYFHHRFFENGEAIFKQHDQGMGFYLIFKGNVDIIVETRDKSDKDNIAKHIVSLDRHDYFGELALLQENSKRNASAIAQDSCQLLGLFKPDMDDLIHHHPVVATKLLQSISMIISNRLFSLTKEVMKLKSKIIELEKTDAN